MRVHLWLGFTLGVLGIFIGITGSILVFADGIDAMLNPSRHAVSHAADTPRASVYLHAAARAVPGTRVTLLRMPDRAGTPVTAFAAIRGQGDASRRVYLDPASARVLDVSATGGMVGWVHAFHENLRLRDRHGREIVGAVGIAMLVSSLTGLYLWWPGGKRFRASLGLRRGLPPSRNLHYLSGFYGCVGLAMLSFTGIFVAFTDAGRTIVGAFLPVSPSAREIAAPPSEKASRPVDVDQAIAIALARHPGTRLWNVRMPATQRDAYRVNLSEAGVDEFAPGRGSVVFVSTTGEVLRDVDAAERKSGDAFLATMRALHSGDALGLAGRLAIFCTGLLPALFVATGSRMWLQRRRAASTRAPAR
jgi:uncharacterized iron-regulated membrane protein